MAVKGWEPSETGTTVGGDWREAVRFASFAISRYPRSFLVVTALVVFSTALILPAPLISKAVVNLVVEGGNTGRIVILSACALIAVVFERCVSYWHGVIIFHQFRCLVCDLRRQLLDHLLRVPLLALQRMEAATLSSRITNDTNDALQAFYDDLVSVAESVITALVCLGAMLLIDVRLGLVVVFAAPVYIFLLQYFGVKIRKLTNTYYDVNASNSSLYYHLIASPVISKMHSHEYIMRGYEASCRQAILAGDAMMRIRAFSYALVLLISNALPVLILLFSALLILDGSFDLGSFVAFTAFMGYLFPSLRHIIEYSVRAQGGAVALRRINELLAIPREQPVEAATPPPGDHLCLKGIRFRYAAGDDGERGALEDVGMRIDRGKPVGLMGESGSGKTTLLKILSGLYDPDSGDITLDGVPLAAAVRRRMTAYVEQEPLLFADTLLENVRLGREDITEERACGILRDVGLGGLLRETPPVRDEAGTTGDPSAFIEQGGANLSLGQKKRIALARGLLKRSDIIVIDEPTAGLDAANAHKVMRLIRRLCAGQFVIIVSHTQDVMEFCDRVYTVKEHRLLDITPTGSGPPGDPPCA